MANPSLRRLAVLSALLCGAAASAQQYNLNVKLEGLAVNNILIGPAVELPFAKPAEVVTKSGADKEPNKRPRVLLLVFWNAGTPAGANTLLMLARMKTEYAGYALQIVAAHRGDKEKPKEADAPPAPNPKAKAAPAPAPKAKKDADKEKEEEPEIGPEEIRAKAEMCGATYTVAESADLAGAGRFPVPHCILFDHLGRCVFRGSPFELEHPLKQAIQKCPLVHIDGNNIGRMASIVETLNSGGGPAQAATAANRLSSSNDYIQNRQAAELINRLNAEVNRRIKEAEALRESDPVARYNMLQLIVKNFGGVDAMRQATEQFSELKNDPKFASEKRAFELLEQVRIAELSLKTPKMPLDPRDPEYQKLNREPLGKMKTVIEGMKKGAPHSQATKAAIAIGAGHGLDAEADGAGAEKPPAKGDRPPAKK